MSVNAHLYRVFWAQGKFYIIAGRSYYNEREGGKDIHYTYNKLGKMSHCIIYISLSYIQLSGLITLSNN